ncbi:ribosome maturation factor RimP [Mucilaginibacter koreensis]
MNVEQRVKQLVEEKIADRPDLFIVDIKLQGGTKLVILVDGDQGAGIDICAQISRHVGFHLEEENTIEHAYTLEVSSPGIDTPLKLTRQYIKNIGRQVAVKKADGTKAEGELKLAGDESITIEEKIKPKGKKAELVETTIPMSDIAETKVLISFK